jgi:hypothetical protein
MYAVFVQGIQSHVFVYLDTVSNANYFAFVAQNQSIDCRHTLSIDCLYGKETNMSFCNSDELSL